jgi:hypothetical protein
VCKEGCPLGVEFNDTPVLEAIFTAEFDGDTNEVTAEDRGEAVVAHPVIVQVLQRIEASIVIAHVVVDQPW